MLSIGLGKINQFFYLVSERRYICRYIIVKSEEFLEELRLPNIRLEQRSSKSEISKDIELLLIDDEEAILQSVSRLLSMDYTVHTAQTPNEAVKKLQEHDIVLCLIDQNLNADKTGIELADQIKTIKSWIKIIMLTGESDTAVVINALNSGAIDSFLSKPFDYKKIDEYIQKNLTFAKQREVQIQSVIQKIKSGQPLSEDDISTIAADLDKIETLMFDYQDDTYPLSGNDEINHLLGIVIFDQNEIVFKYVLSDDFTINDEFMLRGLIMTLGNLPNELFRLNKEAKVLDEIKLPNMHIKVRPRDEYTIVAFLSGSSQLPRDISKQVTNFFDELDKLFGDQFEEKLVPELEIMIDGLQGKLANH